MNATGIICAFLINAFWQSTLLFFAVWIVLCAFRRTNATTRYAVGLSALTASLVLPLATTALTVPSSTKQASTAVSLPVEASVGLAVVNRPAASLPASSGPSHFSHARYTVPPILATAVAWIWSAIAAALILRLALSLLHIEGLKRDALPLAPERRARLSGWSRSDRGARTVRLCVSDRASVPTAIGLFDAMVLIPNDLVRQLDGADLDRIVLHELAHLRRRDDWSNAFAQFVGALLFFSPAVAFAVRQLDLEREVACDDSVLRYDAEALTYANTLARMTEMVAWPHRPLAAPGIFMTRRGMSRRIERILEDGRDVRARLAIAPAALVLGAIVAISLAGVIAPSIALSQPENTTMLQTPIGDASPAEIAYSGAWELKRDVPLMGRANPRRHAAVMYSNNAGGEGLVFRLHYPAALSNWGVPADLRALGIDPRRLSAPPSQIDFAVKRDAGTFDCTGVAGDGGGHGDFRFHPDAAYVAEFAKLGVKLSLQEQVIAGMGNVSLDYVRGLAALGMMPMSFQSLITLDMMGGTLDDVRALRRDFPNADAQAMTSLIMMMRKRLPDVHAFHALFPTAAIDDVLTMGMAGVTPDYVDALLKARVHGLSASNVTALRSVGIDKAFVDRMIASGKTGLTVDEVVALKMSGF